MAKAKKKKAAQKAEQEPAAPAPPPPPPALRSLVIDERLFFSAVVAAAAVFFVWQVRDVLIPLLFVVVVTFLGAPLVEKLEARGIPRAAGAGIFLGAPLVEKLEARGVPRGAGAGIFLVGGLLAFAALVALVAPALVRDIAQLVEKLPAVLARGADLVEKHTGVAVPTTVKDLSGAASKELLDQLSPFAAKGGALVGAGALGLAKGAASAAGFVGKAALVPIISFFLLAELPEVRRFVRDASPARARTIGGKYMPLVNDALSGLVRGQLTVVVIMSLIYVVGLGVSGVPLAVGIGILAGFAYLIPFASASVALALSVAFTLLEKGTTTWTPIIGAVITCVAVQLIEGYVLTPRIVGEKAGLSPLAALLAVLLGGSAAGFLGVLFALPAGAVIALVLREEVLERRSHIVPNVTDVPVSEAG